MGEVPLYAISPQGLRRDVISSEELEPIFSSGRRCFREIRARRFQKVGDLILGAGGLLDARVDVLAPGERALVEALLFFARAGNRLWIVQISRVMQVMGRVILQLQQQFMDHPRGTCTRRSTPSYAPQPVMDWFSILADNRLCMVRTTG